MAQKQFRILFYLKDDSQVYATNNLNNNRDVVQIMGTVFFVNDICCLLTMYNENIFGISFYFIP